jgi:hypothetical protein
VPNRVVHKLILGVDRLVSTLHVLVTFRKSLIPIILLVCVLDLAIDNIYFLVVVLVLRANLNFALIYWYVGAHFRGVVVGGFVTKLDAALHYFVASVSGLGLLVTIQML